MNVFSSIKWYGVVVACVLAAGAANAVAQENDEGPFVEGVFVAKEKIPSGHVEPTTALTLPDDASELLLSDENNNTNEVIFLVDYKSNAVAKAAIPFAAAKGISDRYETALSKGIQNKESDALRFFGNPQRARYVIENERLDDQSRIYLTENDPQEILHRYLVLRYPSIGAAQAAVKFLNQQPGVLYAGINRTLAFSSFATPPNDPYFPINTSATNAAQYQWGMHSMNFPSAWTKTTGHGYVGIADSGIVSPTPADLAANFRAHLSFYVNQPTPTYEAHGTHVSGIIAAAGNNSIGVVGGCPTCSFVMGNINSDSGFNDATVSAGINAMVWRGIQVINASWGGQTNCAGLPLICLAVQFATKRDVLFVAAAGNYVNTTPDFPASYSDVLSVGGIQINTPTNPYSWASWYSGSTPEGIIGSSWAGVNGVVAPARSIVSTIKVSYFNPSYWYLFGDVLNDGLGHLIDESIRNGVGAGNGYGSGTGTSFAAPHVSALAGILRSINPRLSKDSVKSIILASSDRASLPTSQSGYGLPNARVAVDSTIAQTPNRLTPLFSFYSTGRSDYFYTTVPQMASAATWGQILPNNGGTATANRYVPTGTLGISGYTQFPDPWSTGDTPRAQVWIFGTEENPKSASVPLAPLYRLSWKCGMASSSPPAICSSNPYHVDFTYTADPAGVAAFQSVGYMLDGIEGYIYPQTFTQPLGTVRLMRKYNPSRDDHAIFPESELSNMIAQGYTVNSGSDWLGYVYPNTNGNVPAIQ